MKIYYSASNDVDPKTKEFYKNTVDFLQNEGFEVVHCLLLDGGKKKLKSEGEFSNIYNNVLKRIDEAEVFFADISSPSGGVGYQISHAVYQRKPIIVTYLESKESNPSVIIRGIKSKNVMIVNYKSSEDLFKKLPPILNEALKMVKVRFNLVMPNDYYSFIERASKEAKMSKTEYVLSLIKGEKDK